MACATAKRWLENIKTATETPPETSLFTPLQRIMNTVLNNSTKAIIDYPCEIADEISTIPNASMYFWTFSIVLIPAILVYFLILLPILLAQVVLYVIILMATSLLTFLISGIVPTFIVCVAISCITIIQVPINIFYFSSSFDRWPS